MIPLSLKDGIRAYMWKAMVAFHFLFFYNEPFLFYNEPMLFIMSFCHFIIILFTI